MLTRDAVVAGPWALAGWLLMACGGGGDAVGGGEGAWSDAGALPPERATDGGQTDAGGASGAPPDAGGPTAPVRLDASAGAAPSEATILSAYHGLDALPAAVTVLCGLTSVGRVGMPVVFSQQLQGDTVVAAHFRVQTADGTLVQPTCATLRPANEPLELRTVLLAGDFGSAAAPPRAVEVTGELLTVDGNSLRGLRSEVISPVAAGPQLVLAERFGADEPGLDGECPQGTQQIVQLTFEGGVTGPGGADLGEPQRLGVAVSLADGRTVNPTALGDDDPDNHVAVCLAEDSPAQFVTVAAGLFHDPGDDPNPETSAPITP